MKNIRLHPRNYSFAFAVIAAVLILSATLMIRSSSGSTKATTRTATNASAKPVSRSTSFFHLSNPFAPLLSATKSDSLLQDVNSDGTADPGDTLRYTVTITNSGTMAATGLTFSDTIDANTTLVPGSVSTLPTAANDSYTAIGNVSIAPTAAQGLLSNDFDADGDPLTVTAVNTAGTAGQVTFNANGSFTFNPNPGFEGTTSFSYTVSDNDSHTANATVTINVTGMIWFVKTGAPAGGDGRLSSPFNALTGANSFDALAADDPGDNIFVYSGTYSGGLTLKANQRLIGEGASASLAAITGLTPPAYSSALPTTGGANPTLNASVNNIVLATGNTVRGVTLTNTAATALIGTNFGNLTVADTRASNSAGVAVNLNNGNPTASFISISSSFATNGIILNNTTGSFAVTGTGSAGSGGTITNTTGADGATTGVGVLLTNASNVSLAYMQINDHQNYAISGSNVTGFTLSNSVVSGANGNNSAFDEASLNFTNLLGTSAISASTISGGVEDNVRVINSGGTLNLTISNSTLKDNNTSFGNSGINVQTFSNANVTINVTGTAFLNHTGDGMLLTLQGASTNNISVTGSTFTNNFDAIDLFTDQDADLTYAISSNTFLNQKGNPIALGSGTATTSLSQTNGNIVSNIIGNAATVDSGSVGSRGMVLDYRGNGSGAVSIRNNTISHTDFEGIFVDSRLGSGNLQLTITNNVINKPDDNSAFPLGVVNGTRIVSRNARLTCLNMSGNTSSFSGTGDGYSLRQANTAVFQLQGFGGTGTSAASVEAFIEAQNTGGCTVQTASSVVNYTSGTCATPPPASPEDVVLAQVADSDAAHKVYGWQDDFLPVTGGERQADVNLARLTPVELDQMVKAAIARLAAAGLTASEVARLDNLKIELADLDEDLLAVASTDGVKLDDSAAGYGWFLDQTPQDDAEFPVNIGGSGLRAKRSAAHLQQVDLLTVLMREMLHTLSGENQWTVNHLQGLLGMTLQTGVRYMPELDAVRIKVPAAPPKSIAAIEKPRLATPQSEGESKGLKRTSDASPNRTFAGHAIVKTGAGIGQVNGRVKYPMINRARLATGVLNPMSGETVTLSIPVLNPGQSITITFDVTINNPLPNGVCEVVNQGTVTADGGISIVTDDPDTGAANDATRTAVPTAPAITCPANIAVNVAAGQCSASVNFNTTASGCPTPTVTCKDQNNNVITSPHNFAVGVTTVTCTATNAAGSAVCSFTVTVTDNIAPSQINCPAPITTTENPVSSGSATVTYATPTATDNCSVTVTCAPSSGSSFPVGTTTVTCTAADPSGNTTTCSFTVTVNPACTITCPANISVGNTGSQCGAVVNYPAPTTTGNCGTVTCSPASGSFFPKGTTTVTCSTTSGPSCSFTVTVTITTPPTITTCAADRTISADASCQAVVPDLRGEVVATGCEVTISQSPAAGTIVGPGTVTVTLTATNAAGQATCTATLTVLNTSPTTITCPTAITQSNDANQCGAIINYAAATASNACSAVTVNCSPAAGSFFPIGVTNVLCTATDVSGITATCSFTVTITDTQNPTITCPANITRNNDANQCGAVVNYASPTVADNCPGATSTCTPAAGTQFPVGTTTVNCTATDTAGNTASCSFTVTVNDTQAPTITCPANIAVGTDANAAYATVTFAATVSDNCSGATSTCTPASGSHFAIGTTTVNCTATDAAGNSTSCSFTVTVTDNQPPTITCPASIIKANDANQCGAVTTYSNPVVTDNSPGATVSCSPPSGSFFPVGTSQVTCTATDVGGNQATCSFTITVKDMQAPVIVCPANITVANTPGLCSATLNPGVATATDNCPGVTVVGVRSDGLLLTAAYPVGTTVITWTARDAAVPANQTTCTQTITVNDTQAPTITLISGQLDLWPPNHQYQTVRVSDLVASASDVCSGNLTDSVVIASISSDEPDDAAGDGDGNTTNDIVIAANCKSAQLRAERQGTGNGRVYTITFRVKDAAGNVKTATAKVTVPKSQGNNGAAVDDGPSFTVNGTCP